MKYLVVLKNSLFGIVSIVWGIMIFAYSDLMVRAPHELIFTAIAPDLLAWLFIAVGVFHILTRLCHNDTLVIVANVLLAFMYLLVAITLVYTSFYGFAWVALAGIILNQLINAYLIAYGKL